MDEARIEAAARTANWVWASYMTAVSNSVLARYSAVDQQAPALSLTSNANMLILNWPASGVGFSLYAATNLAPPVQWVRATNAVVLTNNQWQAALSTNTATAFFYRLSSDQASP